MRRVVGIDIHRTFGGGGDLGKRHPAPRRPGRDDPNGLEGFGRRLRGPVIEGEAGTAGVQWTARPVNGNCMAVSRVLPPHVKRGGHANPLQVKGIAHAHVKTDKVDAGILAGLYAAVYLPRSGPQTRRRSGFAGWWRAATR